MPFFFLQVQSEESRDDSVSMSIERMDYSKDESPVAGNVEPPESVLETGDALSRDAEIATLQEFMDFYVKLSLAAGRGWGVKQSPESPSAQVEIALPIANRDVICSSRKQGLCTASTPICARVKQGVYIAKPWFCMMHNCTWSSSLCTDSWGCNLV